jgi:hypothetical protein
MEIFNCEQNSTEWFQCRAGVVTASAMHAVRAKGEGKTRDDYMYKIIGEIISGEYEEETFSNDHTKRGHIDEPIALELYSISKDVVLTKVGFVKNFNDYPVGFSPDSLIMDGDRIIKPVEAKSRKKGIQARLLDKGEVPTTVKAQLQTGIWVSESDSIDYVSYSKGMPLFIKTVYRDDTYIKELESEVKRFYDELNDKLNRIQAAA